MNKLGLILLLTEVAKGHEKGTKGTRLSPSFVGFARFSRARKIKLKKYLHDAKCECVCVSKLSETAKYKALKVVGKLIFSCNFLLL